MIDRFFFAIAKAYQQRSKLHKINLNRVMSLTSISVADLNNRSLKGLLLDFDGVMASHGEAQAIDEVIVWCLKVHAALPELQFFLLTNNPFAERSVFFNRQLPFIILVPLIRKKPYPDGITSILNASVIAPKDVLLVDDRLLTGALAAILAGIDCWLVDSPYTNFRKRPVKESFFWILRIFERAVF